ncbi:MAG: serine acetyltransferase [Tyzzerella sp.]|nr:serine acetyltransferase [Tyzzerella sp.]
MNDMTRDAILGASRKLASNYETQDILDTSLKVNLPDRQVVYSIMDDLHKISFPGYFGTEKYLSGEAYAEGILVSLYEKLRTQIKIALVGKVAEEVLKDRAEELTIAFIQQIPKVQELLMKDVEAQLAGDPAANSKDEVILAYPGLYTIFVYRYAHILYQLEVPMLPRIMSEYAHGKTGIDINPGATIGEYFFIDHGTGIVIGETAVIGNGVKIYQGVTLGALSTRKGQALSGVKRHPTIEDDVIIYANATILGGDTVVGRNATVAGNTFVTESIPADAKVSAMMPELKVKMCRTCDKK